MVKCAASKARKGRLPASAVDEAASGLSTLSLSASPKKLKRPVLKAKASPKKKRSGRDRPIVSDGSSRESGSFYEWRSRPKHHVKPRADAAHNFCDQHKGAYDEFSLFKSDYLVAMEARDVLSFGQFLIDSGFIHRRSTCDHCGAACSLQQRADNVNGMAWRCLNHACKACFGITVGTIFEGRKIKILDFLTFAMRWANGAQHGYLLKEYNFGTNTLTWIIQYLQDVVLEVEYVEQGMLGGIVECRDGRRVADIVESDETEIGRKRKGLHGHPTIVLADVIGAISRTTGRLLLETMQKLKPGPGFPTRRFGPARGDEVQPFLEGRISPGSVYITDGLGCQPGLAKKYGLSHISLNHNKGEYSKPGPGFVAHTNTIDGEWGRYKNWMRGKHGVKRERLYSFIKEWQWRRNHRDYNLAALVLVYISHVAKDPIQ